MESNNVPEVNHRENLRAYGFLHRTIRVLVVDHNFVSAMRVLDKLMKHHLIHFSLVENAEEAKALLDEGSTFHICITDLYRPNNNQGSLLELLKNYGRKLYFIAHSDSKDAQMGFISHRLGVQQFILRGPQSYKYLREEILSGYLKMAITNGLFLTCPNYSLAAAAEYVVMHKPQTLLEWATGIGTTDENLQRLWGEFFGTDPLNALCVVNLIYSAEKFQCQKKTASHEYLLQKNEEYAKYWKFFARNYEQIVPILNGAYEL